MMRTPRLLACAALLALRAFATSTPVTLNFTGSAPNPPVGTNFAPGGASGQITPFGTGIVAFSQIVVGSGGVTLTASFSIPNGSSFGGTFQGTSSPNSPNTSFTGNITSGTGIFSQASGSLTFSLNITNLSPFVPTLNYSVTGSGTVDVQNTASGLTITPGGLVFTLPAGSSLPSTQGVLLSNGPGQGIPVTATASGGSWLSVSPGSGTVQAYSSLALTVTADPTGLKAGLYTGQVTLAYGGGTAVIFVELVIGPAGVYIQLSQTGLSFQGNPGAAPPPPQTITATNSGVGPLTGLTVTSTTADGGNWLSIRVTSTSTSSQVVVQATPAAQTLGKHFGTVTFTLPGAPNSPQVATVVLNVTPDTIFFEVDPNYRFFMPGVGNLVSPEVATIYNVSNVPVNWNAQIEYGGLQAPGWLSVSPASGTLPPGVPGAVPQTATLSIAVPTLNTLPPGVYSAIIHVVPNAPVNPIYTDINVEVYVEEVGGMGAQAGQNGFYGPEPAPYARQGSPHSANCTPTQVIARIASPPKGFPATVGLPTPVQAFVLDNCMIPLDTGSVTASFSNGDAPVKLVPIGTGMWSGTWTPHTAAAAASVTVQAQTTSVPILAAGKSVAGTVAAGSADTPLVSSGGVVSAASGTAAIAPGAFVAIFGSNMAGGAVTTAPAGLPFPTSLGGTQVLLGGRALPLYFTAGGQIDAIVPNDIPANTVQQLVVRSGNSLSQPENVIVGAAQPSVFTQDQSGKGPGAILGQKPGGIPALNTPSNPAAAGDALLIYCTGLGTTTPLVPAGTPASATSFSYADATVTVTVGGKPAQVLFAGLAPQYVGLYQVNVLVPGGVAPGNNVPVVVSAAGTDSPPVTVATK